MRSSFNDNSRIVAIGDLHGNYSGFRQILLHCGIIDEQDKWIAERTHLVQLGDILGRGGQPGRIFSLLKKLETEAIVHNSRVHVLIGNHEAMSMGGLFTYITEEEMEDFADESHLLPFEKVKVRAKPGVHEPEPINRKKWALENCKKFQRCLSPNGKVGKWLALHNSAIKINGTLFVHGGLTQDFGYQPLAILNKKVRIEIRKQRSGHAFVHDGSLLSNHGPQWNREYITQYGEEKKQELKEILQFHRCNRMVVGHTPTSIIDKSKTGQILPLYDGQFFCIDTGIGKTYGEHLSAIHIDSNNIHFVYP